MEQTVMDFVKPAEKSNNFVYDVLKQDVEFYDRYNALDEATKAKIVEHFNKGRVSALASTRIKKLGHMMHELLKAAKAGEACKSIFGYKDARRKECQAAIAVCNAMLVPTVSNCTEEQLEKACASEGCLRGLKDILPYISSSGMFTSRDHPWTLSSSMDTVFFRLGLFFTQGGRVCTRFTGEQENDINDAAMWAALLSHLDWSVQMDAFKCGKPLPPTLKHCRDSPQPAGDITQKEKKNVEEACRPMSTAESAAFKFVVDVDNIREELTKVLCAAQGDAVKRMLAAAMDAAEGEGLVPLFCSTFGLRDPVRIGKSSVWMLCADNGYDVKTLTKYHAANRIFVKDGTVIAHPRGLEVVVL